VSNEQTNRSGTQAAKLLQKAAQRREALREGNQKLPS